MIEFSHVYKTYPGPVHALKNINLFIPKGELVFLTGPSGAGKSTLFKMISAFDRPTTGGVKVAGYDISEMNQNQIASFRRQIGVVFQDFKLLKDRTIFENVALPLIIRNERSSVVRRRVEEILELVGLESKLDFLPDALSGGEQQRTAIARALIHRPGVLIADEPTGNLDPNLSEDIMDLFVRAQTQGTTVFIATHDHGMVKRRNKRTVEICDGLVRGDLK